MGRGKSYWKFVVALLAVWTPAKADAIRIDKMPPNLLQLGQYWAPYIVSPSRDASSFPSRFDADGDWDLANNAEKFEKGEFPVKEAAVYFDAFETDQMYTLVYQVYTPFDPKKSDPHEHDCEGVILYIEKRPNRPMGELILMLTRAHDWLIPYFADRALTSELRYRDETTLSIYLRFANDFARKHHDRRGQIEFQSDEYGRHPIVLQGSTETGHGHYKFSVSFDQAQHADSLTKRQSFPISSIASRIQPNRGMVYAYRSQADNPSVVQSSRIVGYSLIPIIETLADSSIRYSARESEEYRERFSLSNHEDDFVPKVQVSLATVFDLPIYFKTSNPEHRKANPYWAWSDKGAYFGVDPVHYLQTNLQSLAKILRWTPSYQFNAYVAPHLLAKGS